MTAMVSSLFLCCQQSHQILFFSAKISFHNQMTTVTNRIHKIISSISISGEERAVLWLRQYDDIHRGATEQQQQQNPTKTKNHLVIMCVRYSSFCRLYPQSSTFHVCTSHFGVEGIADSIACLWSRYMIRFLRFDANMTFYRQTTILGLPNECCVAGDGNREWKRRRRRIGELWGITGAMKKTTN